MSVKYDLEKHHVCFPSKVLSGQAGHILNMVIKEDVDNGTICGVGDYVSFDQYEKADAPSDYEAKILEKAADGNWYVQVTKININEPAILIYEVPEIAENYNQKFTAISNFYNHATEEEPKTVRGYMLTPYDVYELSEDAFDGTPEEGATLTISGQKHVVGEGPSF